MRNMKLRYYLRGLGIGVLVTAVILGVVLQGEEKPLTDAQIRERALELGMVDGKSLVLSDLQETQEDLTAKNDSSEEITEVEEEPETIVGDVQDTDETLPTEETLSTEETLPTEEITAIEEPTAEEQLTGESVVAEEQTSEPRVTGEINTEGDTVTVEIRSGAHSYDVSKMLAQMGLVADAASYDSFLCNNGYSKKIHTGKYLIAIGTGEEEIAKIITGNR